MAKSALPLRERPCCGLGMRVAAALPRDRHILTNLSGRDDKDADHVADKLGL